MKLRLSPRALRDLDDIATYIRTHNPEAARQVRDAISDAFNLLQTYPRAGRLQIGGTRKYALTRYPYLIFYEVDEAAGIVGVATLRHAARQA